MSLLNHEPNNAPPVTPLGAGADNGHAPEGLRLPDFLIVGAPKCGTTTLYQYLQRHPGVFMSTPKEMSFFSKDEVYARGLEWYADLFADAAPGQLCGEASTTYARWPTYPETVERLADTLPEAKLIYLVRNPVDRLYSFYAHRMRDRVTMGIDEFLQRTPEAVHSGLYMSQVERLLSRYPVDRLHVMLLDDLKADLPKELDRVRRFLGLGDFDFAAEVREQKIVANRGEGHYAATRSLTRAIAVAKRTPLVGHATKLVPPSVRHKAFRWLQEGPVGRSLKGRHVVQMTPLNVHLRRKLYHLFEEDLARFERYLDRDLSHWKEAPAHADPTNGGRAT